MTFKVKKIALTIVTSFMVLLLGTLFFLDNFGFKDGSLHHCIGRASCSTFLQRKVEPGDVRLLGRLSYFDVISVEAHVNNPHPYSGDEKNIRLDPRINFTDQDFDDLARKIFLEEFKNKFGDVGVVIAKPGDPFTFKTNPHMAKIEFSLQENGGRTHVTANVYRTMWARGFVLNYDSGRKDGGGVKRGLEEIRNSPNIKETTYLSVKHDGGEYSRYFIPSTAQNEFVVQVDKGIREALSLLFKRADPEPAIAREYTKILSRF